MCRIQGGNFWPDSEISVLEWTPEEEQRLIEAYKAGAELPEMIEQFGRGEASCRTKITHLLHEGLMEKRDRPLAKRKTRRELNQQVKREIKEAATRPTPDGYDQLSARCRELEIELARLREQKKWETHSDPASSTGGVLTLRDSDAHHADENHLLACRQSLEEKFCVLLERYEPERIQYVGFDDWIAGRGIFKEQDLQLAVSDITAQIAVGAIKARRLFQKIRKVTAAPITVKVLQGNHEYASNNSIGPLLFDKIVLICSDIPNLKLTYCGNRIVLNLAAEGFYNALFMHGFGHSNSSPNSPKFVDAVKDLVIQHQRKLPPEQHIRRVASGHTHWLNEGLERVAGLSFDTTGGWQRNTRVQLGMNQRPSGSIAYISTRGMESDIMRPVELRPEPETLERERADTTLALANKSDCAECLEEYQNIMRERGLLEDSDAIGVTEGRW